ncbi:hypothetical protein [Thalassospira sp.]|uniref:hypothetical protein n=1 Tax=Thalassospira sp. TaxID=1912094 RepID=UPI002732ABA9|nr:hypothetical protein [Thalassospira sp.]MDP2697365.1 hypothetical protein [Thalassospira sp.]
MPIPIFPKPITPIFDIFTMTCLSFVTAVFGSASFSFRGKADCYQDQSAKHHVAETATGMIYDHDASFVFLTIPVMPP